MELSTVGAALEIVARVSKGLELIRERIKASKDAALKEAIGNLYDEFLNLRAMIVRLTEQNAELRTKLAAQAEKPPKPQIRQVGETNYYFVGEDGPFCQPCYDLQGKLMRLMPLQDYAGGPGRKCEVCDKVFFESRRPAGQIRMYRG